MLQQICAGMEALAEEGIVHRDLALRNVLLFVFDAADVGSLSVKVSDFGLSLSVYGGTHQTVAGGPKPVRYMASATSAVHLLLLLAPTYCCCWCPSYLFFSLCVFAPGLSPTCIVSTPALTAVGMPLAMPCSSRRRPSRSQRAGIRRRATCGPLV